MPGTGDVEKKPFLRNVDEMGIYYKYLLINENNRSPKDVTDRVDRLISEIRQKYHEPVIGKPLGPPGDVLIVAHGHILRAFAMRWAGKTLQDGPSLLLEAGGVGTLR